MVTFEDFLEQCRQDMTKAEVDLSDYGLTNEGLRKFCKILPTNTSICVLQVSLDMFIPYSNFWQDLALSFRSNFSITKLDLSNNKLSNADLGFIASILRVNSHIKILDLRYNSITSEQLKILADALNTNSSLEILDLSDTLIDDDDIKYLFGKLNRNSKFTKLIFRRIVIGIEAIGCIARKLDPKSGENLNIKSLDLGDNKIGDEAVQIMAESLTKNTTLTALYLWNAEIGDQGASALSTMLRENTTISLLDLGKNNIGEKGTHDISDVLDHNRTITTLYLNLSTSEISPSLLASIKMKVDRNSSSAKLKERLSFVMGLHRNLGKQSALNQASSSPIFDRRLISLIFQFTGASQTNFLDNSYSPSSNSEETSLRPQKKRRIE